MAVAPQEDARMAFVRIEFTVETRGGRTVRKAKEVPVENLEKTIEKLSDKGAFSFEFRYREAAS
jgi:hypothetical protein